VVLARLLSRSGILAPGVASAAGSGRRVRNLNVLATLRNSLVRPSRLLGVFASLVGSQPTSLLRRYGHQHEAGVRGGENV
jgi:hypothetical protein